MTSSVEERTPAYTALRGRHVLIADDFDAIRTLYRTGLSLALPELRISTAADGLEALRLAAESRPDVVLMDVSMPGLDGLEATRRLKADPRTSGICIIIVTGTLYDARTVLEAGCDGYLLKPVTASDILREIARVLRA
jgi:two-component system cell cycle response regulator DivK